MAKRPRCVIFTGSPPSERQLLFVRSRGAAAYSVPLIETAVCAQLEEASYAAQLGSYDWLLFTSQKAVAPFASGRLAFPGGSTRIAAVGEKTAQAILRAGGRVDFAPTLYTADAFVEEFPAAAAPGDRCLFLKGNLAKDTLKTGLPQPVDEWTVYETVARPDRVPAVASLVCEYGRGAAVLFASPSAVYAFCEHAAAAALPANSFCRGAIGHITARALADCGRPADFMPPIYTMDQLLVSWDDYRKDDAS